MDRRQKESGVWVPCRNHRWVEPTPTSIRREKREQREREERWKKAISREQGFRTYVAFRIKCEKVKGLLNTNESVVR